MMTINVIIGFKNKLAINQLAKFLLFAFATNATIGESTTQIIINTTIWSDVNFGKIKLGISMGPPLKKSNCNIVTYYNTIIYDCISSALFGHFGVI